MARAAASRGWELAGKDLLLFSCSTGTSVGVGVLVSLMRYWGGRVGAVASPMTELTA